MQRRAYLAAVGGATGLVAGCTAGDGGGTPTSDESSTTTPTPSETPTPTVTPVPPPKVLRVQLVTRWEQHGDLDEHAIRSADVGGRSTVAYRYRAWPHSGKIKTFEQVQAAGPSEQIGTFQNETEVIVESPGPQKFEGGVGFEVTTSGTQTVEVLVRDEISGAVSEPVTYTFEAEQG